MEENIKNYVFHVVLVGQFTDWAGYTSYVFRNLDECDVFTRYMMCVRFPNWKCGFISNGEVGYVLLRYVREGRDEWFNGKEFVKYKHSNTIFLNFVPEDEYTTESFRELAEFERVTVGTDVEDDDSDIGDSEE